MGEPIDPASVTDPAVRALAHAMVGEPEPAAALVARAIEEAPEASPTWDVAIVLRDAWGQDVDDEIRIASVVRGRGFPPRQVESGIARLSFDISIFRAYPRDGLVRDAVRLIPSRPYPWLLAEVLP
jgi:hypothetical protein